MTLKEADKAAQKMLPVTYKGIEYERITQIGCEYDKKGRRSDFVQLLDKCGHSVVSVDPGFCKVKEEHHEA